MYLKSSMAEKRGPYKDCPLVKPLHACVYMHSHGHTHTHAHTDHDTWVLGEAGQATLPKIMVEMVQVHVWVCWRTC